MSTQEAMQLQTGDAVQFNDGVQGTVLNRSKYAVEICWADGQHGFIALEDMGQVTKL